MLQITIKILIAYRSQRKTLDNELINSHNNALIVWQQRTAEAVA
ncbi:MAG: hypothetical protein AB8U93_02640 [Francisella endosymbiont of Hyalomma scupense]